MPLSLNIQRAFLGKRWRLRRMREILKTYFLHGQFVISEARKLVFLTSGIQHFKRFRR